MHSPPPTGSGRRKQSRIVVNVEDVARRAGARRAVASRRKKILALVALVLGGTFLLVFGGGFWWWQSHKKSPAYSLALLVDAAQRNDTQAIEGLIDSDRVAQSLAPQVVNKAMASAGGMGTLAAPRRQIETALPHMLPGMRDVLRAEIARGVGEMAVQQERSDLPFFLLALAMPRMWESIREEGDTVTINFKIGERPVELTMQRADERWKVVGIKDDELAANIAERVVGSLSPAAPAIVAPPSNQPRRRNRR